MIQIAARQKNSFLLERNKREKEKFELFFFFGEEAAGAATAAATATTAAAAAAAEGAEKQSLIQFSFCSASLRPLPDKSV